MQAQVRVPNNTHPIYNSYNVISSVPVPPTNIRKCLATLGRRIRLSCGLLRAMGGTLEMAELCQLPSVAVYHVTAIVLYSAKFLAVASV